LCGVVIDGRGQMEYDNGKIWGIDKFSFRPTACDSRTDGSMRAVAFIVITVFILACVIGSGAVLAEDGVSTWDQLRQAVADAGAGGTVVLARDLEADSEIAVNARVTLSGGGHTISPAAGYSGRAFSVSGATVTFRDLRFEGFSNPGSSAAGGAVFSRDATLSLVSCVFSGNRSGHSGGAVYAVNGSVTAGGCSFSGNAARTASGTAGNGGALLCEGADVTLRDSVFSDNAAGRYGGAVYVSMGSEAPDVRIALEGCTFSSNTAGSGGGAAYAAAGVQPVRVSGCAFRENSVSSGGGGGVEARAQSVYVTGSSFVKNRSPEAGPALKLGSGVLHLDAETAVDGNAGEGIALAYGYGVDRLVFRVEGKAHKSVMDIGERAELVIGSGDKDAEFVIESGDESVVKPEDGGAAKRVEGGYAAAFRGAGKGRAQITLREPRGKAYAVLEFSVSGVSAACAMTDISFAGIRDVRVTREGTEFTVAVPAGTDVTRLVPKVTHSGASLFPRDGVPMDFSEPVTFTVTAENGKTKKYVVRVQAGAGEPAITGLPENRIVYAGGQYTLRATMPGGKWSFSAPTLQARTDGDALAMTPVNAGGAWVEYTVETKDGPVTVREEFTVAPALMPAAGQRTDGIALMLIGAALCVAALRLLPRVPEKRQGI